LLGHLLDGNRRWRRLRRGLLHIASVLVSTAARQGAVGLGDRLRKYCAAAHGREIQRAKRERTRLTGIEWPPLDRRWMFLYCSLVGARYAPARCLTSWIRTAASPP